MKKRQTAALVGYVEAIDFFSVSIPSYRVLLSCSHFDIAILSLWWWLYKTEKRRQQEARGLRVMGIVMKKERKKFDSQLFIHTIKNMG